MCILTKLVRQGQEKQDERPLVLGLDRKNVQANAFGLSRFTQQSITFGAFERGGDSSAAKDL
jgi:hypothetical protein